MFGFQKYWSPILIQIIYILGLVFIAISGVAAVVAAGRDVTGYGPLATSEPTVRIIGVLVACAMLLLIWRVLCEFWMVIFSINDRLGVLVQRGEAP